MEIAISPEAARFIRERGGRLFIWAHGGNDRLGYLRWDTEPPDGGIGFELHHATSFELYLQPGIEFGDWLEVRLRRLPPRGLTLDWQGRFPTVSGG